MIDDLPVQRSQPYEESTAPVSDRLRALHEQFQYDRDPDEYLAKRSALVDEMIRGSASRHLITQLSFPFAVLAVGGYGRQELFPYSDVDLLLLTDKDADLASAKEPLAKCLQVLWDAGLSVSHSVRTKDECCTLNEQNVQLHVSLLDARFVCGERPLFDALNPKLAAFYAHSGQTIAEHITALASKRHAKFNETAYHLEPQIKEGPGGLRDFHLLRWLAKLTPQHGVIQQSVRELESARHFLFALRCFLHLESNRDNNLLTFELQDQVALRLAAKPLAPEEWMRAYFTNARAIFGPALRAMDLIEAHDPPLLRQFQDWRGRLSTPEFTVSRERIFLRNPAETQSSPESLLRLFTFAARHGFRLSWDTQRRLRTDAAEVKRSFAEDPPQWTAWREFLTQPHSAVALIEMAETGVLSAAIPEWESIDSLVVRDFYHRYTVDEHTIVAVGTVDHLASSNERIASRFADLLRGDDNPAIIRFALLLHDIGKGMTPGEHVRGSLEAAQVIMARLQVPENDRDTVLFLIDHHLDLWTIMNGRDVEDPATARQLAAQMGTQERLRRLALMTYADISAVNSTAMTPWRVEQLWRVYSLGSEQLRRELVTDRIHGNPNLLPGGPPSAELSEFLEGFPTRYLRTHSRETIEHHLSLAVRARERGVAVELADQSGTHLLTALAFDSPGLFASLCGTLASFGMNIVKAEAFSNTDGMALDEFRFSDPIGTLQLNPEERQRLQLTAERVVSGILDVRELLKRRRPKPRPSRGARIYPTVRFNNEVSETATLIDFVAEDRPGLLYGLVSALRAAECNIELVLINTEAHKAIDVIYVTQGGAKLDDADEELLRIQLIEAAEGA